MGIKDFFVKKMLASQLKKTGLPKEQQDMITAAVLKNPEFFEKIAKEAKQLEKQGKSQQVAMMEVMRKHQGELQKIMMGK
jgi:hypothetical protein